MKELLIRTSWVLGGMTCGALLNYFFEPDVALSFSIGLVAGTVLTVKVKKNNTKK